MLGTWDLGFVSLVHLGLCLIFPVIGFVIRYKWRAAVARNKEIQRLLLLASQESARAEFEAAVGYGAVSVPQDYQCAVCFCPTTTRCAQCKAVRYCSGKCQIIHWRQGHKEECHPRTTSHQFFDKGNSGHKAADQQESVTYNERFDVEGRRCKNPVETFPEKHTRSFSTLYSEVPHGKDDNRNVEELADRKETDSTSESSDTSFSGFSASNSSNESSDDVSVSESSSSCDPEKLDGHLSHLSPDAAPDILDTNSINTLNQSKPLSPKFASLVDSVDIFPGLSKSNEIKSGCSDGEGQCASTNSAGLISAGMHEDSSGKNCSLSSSFWRRTLDSVGSGNDAHVDSPLSNSCAAGNEMSDSASLLKFSFNLPGVTSVPPSHAQISAEKGILSGDAHPTNLVTNKHGATSSAEKGPLSSCERSGHNENDTSSNSHVLDSRELKSSSSKSSHAYLSSSSKGDSLNRDVPDISSLPSSSSEWSNNVLNGTENTSQLLKCREVKRMSSTGSDAHSLSDAGGHSVSSVESRKVGDIHTSAAISSHSNGHLSNPRSGLKTSVLKYVDQFRGSKLSKTPPLGVGSDIAGRYSDKGLFPYDNFVKLYNWNKEELQPFGLINCGNSCYANAVLQCLTFTPPLTAYFLQGLHSKACLKKDWCFTCEFESLILKAKSGKSSLSPIGILSQLQNIASQLGNGREEDAHEFLTYSIDAMQSVCLMEAGVIASGSSEEETTLMGLTFGGYLRSKIKCLKCQGKSERQERMMDLTVEIEGDIGTLEEALRRFTATELLDGENKYKCCRCQSYEKAKKKLKILEAPNVLTIVLKRFQSGKFGKINKPIRFPEILNLAPYMSGTSDKSPIYRLYGVIVHLDIMNASFSGHYVCYVKNIQNKWFKIDDNTVTAVELERVLTKGAYMLLYARCSPRAPRSIRNRNVTTSKSRVNSAHQNFAQFSSSTPSDGHANTFASFYSRFHRLQRILEVDSSSDNSSLISSYSDEGSCSTESTSTDDFSDYIHSEGHSWNSPWRSSSDSDTSSSSSSPLYARHSPLSYKDRYDAPSRTNHADSNVDRTQYDSSSGLMDFKGKVSLPILHSDTKEQCRKLTSSRETNSKRLGSINPPNGVKSSVLFRKSTRDRTD